jgi:RimJ/RimL family protein N-acetyltransferase
LPQRTVEFHRAHAGKGYATEAVEALVQLAFGHLGAKRLELVTDWENVRSRKLAERCGFVLEGVLHNERRAPDGTLRDTCLYARLQ